MVDFGLRQLVTDAVVLDLHWNEEEKMYCDVSINEDGMRHAIISEHPPLLTMPAR